MKKARPANAESHYLHYQLNDLNTEKNPALFQHNRCMPGVSYDFNAFYTVHVTLSLE